jgi:hypothetical protein
VQVILRQSTEFSEQLSDYQQAEALERLAAQALDILRELYNSRSLLRRRVTTVNGAATSAPSAKKAWAKRKWNSRKGERYGPSKRYRGDGEELPRG